ncbi:MAG: asparagine synthase (glutamine-hydrolyzing) [Bacteroidetes bacterium]|nr:asparagine synthase (glutamine-hydrolyzing) [Bacteroidota bacterium]
MCGITGILHFDKQRTVDDLKLKKITEIINYRGPDGDGFYFNKNIGLGHRRLSIIDLSTGNQPMYSHDKNIVIVLNGEIYNYIELRKELIEKGHKFKTTSDTEVVLKAYEEWGIDCQNKFNGMWAFAIWDERKQQLFLSRDRIGEKPLHYAAWDNSLIFGSEIKSLLAYGIPKEPQLEFLEIYSVFKYIPSPFSFYKHIKKLMPGHYIIANNNGFKEYKYWDLPLIEEDNMFKNANQVHERFTELFEDSIKIRMRCDVPFGAFLSGGLDSASIVALMSGNSKFPINTFTIGYKENEFDESKLAELVAKKFNTNHHLGTVNSDNFTEALNTVVNHYDEPFGDSSAIPTGYVSKFAAQKVKMVLTGDGGDEVLSGYTSYQGIKFAQKYQSLPLSIQKFLPEAANISSKALSGKYRYKLNRINHLLLTSSKGFNQRLLEKQSKPGRSILKSLIDPKIKTWKVEDYFNDVMNKCPYKDDFYKQMYLNFKYDLPEDMLVKVDRMSMAYSLETRVPFLDHRLIEFMVGVDKNVKMQGWQRKSVLRNTVAKKLPAELLKASKKGFRVPVREWFKNKVIQDHLLNFTGSGSVFNINTIQKLINDNAEGKNDNGNLLWSLLVLNETLK